MPRFQPLSHERIAELTRRAGGGTVDLSAQKDWINQALKDGQGWGSIDIDPGDNIRALKRRTTIAGKELAEVTSPSGAHNFVRLVTYLPGTPLAKIESHSPELLRDLGQNRAGGPCAINL